MSVAKKDQYLKTYRSNRFIAIFNYETIWRKPICETILRFGWDIIVLDESHKISAPGSKVSWFCKGLKSEYKIIATGTPMSNPLSIYGQYRFLNQQIFGKSFNLFKSRYAVEVNMGSFKKVVAYQNEDELHHRMYSIARRIKKNDVLDLPSVVETNMPCQLPKETREIYDEFENELIIQWRGGKMSASNALVKALRLQQITGGMIKYDTGIQVDLGTEKYDVLEELMNGLPDEEPFVIFCKFSNEIKRIKQIKGYKFAELSGKLNQLQQWKNGEFDKLVVQIQAGGVGIDLTRACYCAYMSTGYSLTEYQQSLARLDRPGQTRNVSLYHIVAENTIDVKIRNALARGYDTVERLLSGMLTNNFNECNQSEAMKAAIRTFME